MLVYFADELCLQGAITCLAQLVQFFLAQSIALPLACGALVATYVEIGVREYCAQFGDNVLGKLNSLGVGHVEHVGTDTAVYPHLGSIARVARELWVCSQCGNEMSGHIDLGQHVNVALGSVTHNIPHLLLCVVEGAILAVGLRALACPIYLAVLLNLGYGSVVAAAALGTLGCEQRILLYLGTPTLVVGKVPMKHIHFVNGHKIYHFLHLLNGEEMAAHVEHKATIAKAGLILDACNGECIRNTLFACLSKNDIGRQ